jgi:hypothetical protein
MNVSEVLDQELGALTGLLAAQEDAAHGREAIRRFGDLIRATPALRAYQADSLRRHLDRAATPALLHEQVTADVRRAARLIETGLCTFAAQDRTGSSNG